MIWTNFKLQRVIAAGFPIHQARSMRVLDRYHALDRYHTASCYVQPADIVNADVLGSSLNSTSAWSAQKHNGRVCSVLLSQMDPIATCTLKKSEGLGGRE